MPSKLAISSMSLGRCFAGHSLDSKLDAAQRYGYLGIELFYEDLVDVAEHLSNERPSPEGPFVEAQIAAARHILQMCQARGLEVVCLQPFMHYDGLNDRAEHERRLEKLALWIELAHELHTDIIQIPANFLPANQVSDNLDLIVSDLCKVADIGAQALPPIRFAYESLCWSTRVDLWERCWDIVQRVDRPNFGICLDTFNILGRIYADPTSPSGRTPNAKEAVRKSIANLVSRVDVSKVFYVQVVDAERLSKPLLPGHPYYNPEQPARMSWSRNCRLFYGETEYGAYLPVKEVARALFHGIGFEGWVSLELFNRRMSEEGPEVPEELAMRGAISWAKLVQDLRIPVEGPLVTMPRVSASL
ncbi:DHS dehydratase [Neurospora crassa OR74A]|uniref:3-dehydroshikimate dehydratase n=1 Tax=Neurospora crassa (strain ATCC 24698 / 74-OR23-1A / CBS 708.71 / DSM 1257 / FGSC 987) TaxID=367110 RepID=3SHD_NEUCR|nr:DHS dehydratase [Neurospora crassa OR74A]P07046.1 RecName: Full=3-dehydroshikimate dehydratase; Short=DHS dehydratase; Short=DHSase; AltName: Full=Quinic acid degradation cluster protein 4 [Neurospora crassa OR74A]AAA33613.1 3-dehydroshikimate dehydratase [Neurospora crassa]EAA30378.1 DHS dehydratase [Neurospora crassa OR74A]CAA32750.1 DHS dehydratase [Neurospora crassa]|eukprot:XP_959614.1 DHS dehydratase [Neurospora crassa OR74A]